ncbi:MAG: hypothetical protein OSA51_08705, partial [Octadecabacter sp.]|nr:hypothetical protein [Octadecabacter sp.]
ADSYEAKATIHLLDVHSQGISTANEFNVTNSIESSIIGAGPIAPTGGRDPGLKAFRVLVCLSGNSGDSFWCSRT